MKRLEDKVLLGAVTLISLVAVGFVVDLVSDLLGGGLWGVVVACFLIGLGLFVIEVTVLMWMTLIWEKRR